MQIRRPLAGLFVAATLFGGGAALAGCGDPVDSGTGTPADTVSSTPSAGASTLPDNGGPETSSSRTGGDVGNGAGNG